MNENNELLMYIYQNANMGVKSCTNLIRILQGKDNKIKKNKLNPKEIGLMADVMSKVSMNMEMMKDNSDARVADMLTKGFTMGNVDITKKIDRFEKDADKDILKLAKDLLNFGKENIEILKPYL